MTTEAMQGHTPLEVELIEALRDLLSFPLALEPHCGESDGDLEITIGHANYVLTKATGSPK